MTNSLSSDHPVFSVWSLLEDAAALGPAQGRVYLNAQQSNTLFAFLSETGEREAGFRKAQGELVALQTERDGLASQNAKKDVLVQQAIAGEARTHETVRDLEVRLLEAEKLATAASEELLTMKRERDALLCMAEYEHGISAGGRRALPASHPLAAYHQRLREHPRALAFDLPTDAEKSALLWLLHQEAQNPNLDSWMTERSALTAEVQRLRHDLSCQKELTASLSKRQDELTFALNKTANLIKDASFHAFGWHLPFVTTTEGVLDLIRTLSERLLQAEQALLDQEKETPAPPASGGVARSLVAAFESLLATRVASRGETADLRASVAFWRNEASALRERLTTLPPAPASTPAASPPFRMPIETEADLIRWHATHPDYVPPSEVVVPLDKGAEEQAIADALNVKLDARGQEGVWSADIMGNPVCRIE